MRSVAQKTDEEYFPRDVNTYDAAGDNAGYGNGVGNDLDCWAGAAESW